MREKVTIPVIIILVLLMSISFGEETIAYGQNITSLCLIDLYESLLSETNEATGYKSIIEDAAGLLKDDENITVLKTMKPITDYCHIGFLTYPVDGSNELNCSSKTKLWENLVFHDEKPYVVFIIDMKTRFLGIYTNQTAILTNEKVNSITDNVFNFATNGEFKTCALETFTQILECIKEIYD